MRRLANVFITALFLAALSSPAASAAEPAGDSGTAAVPAYGTVGERFGTASSHIKLYPPAQVDAELDAMVGVGSAWLRCDFAWSDLEPERGTWVFAGSDRVVDKAGARGVEILGILGTSPPWANGGNEWMYPPTDLDAWRTYVRTVASRYRGRVSAWEIWNEQNTHAFWMPEPDAAAYVELLAAASAEIRASDPGATVVMGGVAGLDPAYLDACLSLGAADHIDAIAYHPYAETIGEAGQPEEDTLRPKERLCRDIVAFVHWLVSLHSDKDLEIWLTEVGWTTSAASPAGVDEATQAAYMLRTMVNYAQTDVDRFIWFNLRDTHLNEWDRYGLMAWDLSPKPAYGYYATFSRVFGPALGPAPGAASFTCSRPQTLEAHPFRLPDGGLAVAAWKSDDAPDTLAVNVPDPSLRDPLSVDPLTGSESPTPGAGRDAAGNIIVSGLPVGKTPVILVLEKDAPGPDARTFYFAEGYTGEGFQQYLCVGNMGEVEADVDVEFLFVSGPAAYMQISVPVGSRATVDVNAAVGEGREVAMVVTSRQDIVAERPMYFTYGAGWSGGHVVIGTREPSSTHFFAEGYTGEGFDEWICVLNPGDSTADLTLRFQTEEEGEKVVEGLAVGARSRASFKVNELLGAGYQASCKVESSRPVVAERPMYFDYRGRGDHRWQGGHCVMGASSLASRYWFAEGTTRGGFEQWLTLQNPNASAIQVRAVYHFGPGQGEPVERVYDVAAKRRLTVFVPGEVGLEYDVSMELSSGSAFLAERPMYFDYTGLGAGNWRGGHCIIGATSASNELFFAEGYTGEGFHEWLCLHNAGDRDAVVEVSYLTQERGTLTKRMVTVPSRTRITIFVNEHAGTGYQLSCRLRVVSGPPITAERPMYFTYAGRDGGHDVTGYAAD